MSLQRKWNGWAVVGAQLEAGLLPSPEDPGSNPAISNFYKKHIFSVNCWKDKNNEKETGNGTLKNNLMAIELLSIVVKREETEPSWAEHSIYTLQISIEWARVAFVNAKRTRHQKTRKINPLCLVWTRQSIIFFFGPKTSQTWVNSHEGSFKGCHHSSVDSSVPSILPPRVRVPSTLFTLLSILIWIASCWKDENK